MDEQTEKLYDAAMRATEVLYSANTVFPFTFFPDTITIDREKLSIAYRFFFGVAQVANTPLDDIETTEVNSGPFFGSLRITSKFFVNNLKEVNFLKRSDAINIQQILQGYKLAKEKEIDLTKVEKGQLVNMLTELGKQPKD